MWPPACSPSGNVSLPSRRGGACPSRWFPEGFHFTRRFSPEGRNSVRRRAESSRPTGVMVHGRRAGQSPAPTMFQADRSKTGGRAGQSPAPTMFQADHSKNGQRAHAVRPYGGHGPHSSPGLFRASAPASKNAPPGDPSPGGALLRLSMIQIVGLILGFAGELEAQLLIGALVRR